MKSFICPFCKYEAVLAQKHGQELVFCQICGIYWGYTAEQVSDTLKSPLLKHVFTPVLKIKEPMHTKSDKFWYTFSAVLVLIAALLV